MHIKHLTAGCLTLLVCLCALGADFDPGDGEFEGLDPGEIYPDHQPGEEVELPPLNELVGLGQQGDTLVLQYRQTIPSKKRALDSLMINYRYTLGDKTGRVISREISTKGYTHMPVGTDGVVAMNNGWTLTDGTGNLDEPTGLNAVRDWFKKRDAARYPHPVSQGLLYQQTSAEPGGRLGAVFYIPREGRRYRVDQQIKIADEGYGDLGVHPHNNGNLHVNNRYVVLLNSSQSDARVLDLKTKQVHAFALTVPPQAEKWHTNETLIGESQLMFRHALYDLATGNQVATRPSPPVAGYDYGTLLRDGVCYGIRIDKFKDEAGVKRYRYTVWARPAMGNGQRTRELLTIVGEPVRAQMRKKDQPLLGCFAGEGGFVYGNGKKWIKTDWLKLDDFEEAQAE